MVVMGSNQKENTSEASTRPNKFSKAELLTCSSGEMYGPGNAQLPSPPMLMCDRIAHISEIGGSYNKGEIIAELDITSDLWFFGCHFP